MPHIVVDVMSKVSTLLGISVNRLLIINPDEQQNVEYKFELAIGLIFISIKIYF